MNLNLLHYDVLDSTMDEAARLLDEDCAVHMHHAVIAGAQSKGRGRQARVWESHVGNLFVTYILEPIQPDLLSQYAMLWGTVIRDAVDSFLMCPVNLQCKWPNDLLLNDQKVGGLLIETYARGGQQAILVGVGINLVAAPAQAIFPATSLKDFIDPQVTATQLSQKIYEIYTQRNFDWRMKGFESIRKRWQDVAWRLGHEINIRQNDQTMIGVFEKIDTIGAIILKDNKGQQHRFLAGDLFKETKYATDD